MKEHIVRAVSLGTTIRLLKLGKVAVGFPLPDGWSIPWSIEGGPFILGEEITLHFESRKGNKRYWSCTATIEKSHDDAFFACFNPCPKDCLPTRGKKRT